MTGWQRHPLRRCLVLVAAGAALIAAGRLLQP